VHGTQETTVGMSDGELRVPSVSHALVWLQSGRIPLSIITDADAPDADAPDVAALDAVFIIAARRQTCTNNKFRPDGTIAD